MRTSKMSIAGLVGGMHGSKEAQLVTIQPRPSLLAVLAINLAKVTGMVLRGLARHRTTTLTLGVAVVVSLLAGPWGLPVLAVVVAMGLVVWRRLLPDSYRHVVVSRWRGAVVYRRCWQPAMDTCGLTTTLHEREYHPTIRRVVSEECVDWVLVDLLSGQCPENFEAMCGQLAHTFGARRVRVKVDRPGRVWLEFTHTDPLKHTIPALEPVEEPDLRGLRIGQREDGAPWWLRLLGMHVLIAGATGSGKGSVLWSLIRAMGPRIRAGSVQVWAVDPKGGMELTPGAGLFTRFAYDSPEAMVALLEDAVVFMRNRAESLRQAGKRVHVPTPDEPLVVVVVDELAALTAYCGDRDLKKRAEAALQLLLSKGRAPGVLVVAAVQDPGKDVIAFRDLFPTRIALRLLEDVQVDMVLGRSARQHGAECDQIAPSQPGVGYVVLEGIREPARVRAAYVSDDDLAQMVRDYGPDPAATGDPRLRLVDEA